MAARLRKMHQDDVRAKIQTSQLINRLTDHVLKGLELSATQVSAALGLIKKTLPDLQSVALTGEDGGAIEVHQTLDTSQLTDEQNRALASIHLGGRDLSEEGTGPTSPDRVH